MCRYQRRRTNTNSLRMARVLSKRIRIDRSHQPVDARIRTDRSPQPLAARPVLYTNADSSTGEPSVSNVGLYQLEEEPSNPAVETSKSA